MRNVISLKRHIDSNRDELLRSALASYRGVLEAVGKSSSQACPPVGASLEQSLLALRDRLSEQATPSMVLETQTQAEADLTQWGQNAAAYYRQRAAEIKEILVLMAAAAESAGERDHRYVDQVQEFTGRLEGIADLQDISQMRESLVRNALELKVCADRMAEESRESAERWQSEIGAYRTRLDEAERLAGVDALTGLDNRRKVEASIECRIAAHRPFSVVLLDLNGFKQINDAYGHQAGDDVLKQFATELKAVFRAIDVVGRWGGDEFLVVLDGGMDSARAQAERLRKWTLGEYRIQSKGAPVKLKLDAAIGLSTFQTGDGLTSLIERADAAMYADKAGKPR